MRLQKYIAAAGVCSRRRGGGIYPAGESHGQRRDRLSRIGRGRRRRCLIERQASFAAGGAYICSSPQAPRIRYNAARHARRPTVAELVQDAGVRLFPVGRLDCMSEGLLLFTDDGEMANRLAHPSHGVSKTYRVWVSGPGRGGSRRSAAPPDRI